MEFQNVKFEKKDGVAWITLNNPAKRNPINIDTHRELRECFDLADYDDEVRAVVIRGAGGNFSAGGDLNAMKQRIDNGVRGTRKVCRKEARYRLGRGRHHRRRHLPRALLRLPDSLRDEQVRLLLREHRLRARLGRRDTGHPRRRHHQG